LNVALEEKAQYNKNFWGFYRTYEGLKLGLDHGNGWVKIRFYRTYEGLKRD